MISGLEASARQGDTVAFTTGLYTAPWHPNGITVGTAGVIVGKLLSDTVDHTYAVTAGMNPLRFKTITEAGTTAADMVVVRG